MKKPFEARFLMWNGVALTLMLVIAFAVDLTIWISTGGPPVIDPNNLSTDLVRAQNSSLWVIETWMYLLLVIPGLTLTMGVKNQLLNDQNHGIALSVGNISMILFWIFHTLHNAVLLTILYGTASYLPSDVPLALSFETTASSLLHFSNILFGFGTSVGGLFFILALGLFGYVTSLNQQYSKWIARIAFGASIGVLLSYLQFLSSTFTGFGLLGWILFIFWVFAMTIRLARSNLEN